MREALALARKAYDLGEVPIGAVVELGGKVIGRGFNQTRTLNDPSAHAEIVALREACKNFGDFRLEGGRVFVTVEPCLMCLGAILIARISEVHFGISEPKFGAHSVFALFNEERFRKTRFQGGYLEEEITELMSCFFRNLREQ